MSFCSTRSLLRVFCTLILIFAVASQTCAQQRREREPNSTYSMRRALLSSQTDGPIILWGFTGREEFSQSYIFSQENNFYYLTGHNEEGTGLIILPPKKNPNLAEGPREILFLPAKNPGQEKWNGVRLSPTDAGIETTAGFPTVKPFSEMRAAVENLAKFYPAFYTILPYQQENGGYPHEKAVVDWLKLVAPQANVKDIRPRVEALRQIKSTGEIAFLQKAVDLSLGAHVEAMKMMRPGLFEYQVAAKMVEVHAMGGSEAEGYAPIVGAGPNSTALHYDKLDRKIQDGDIVVLDVGAQYSGYSADITRTLPANGKFTQRQREIYEIVLGAQSAAIAAIKPGANFCRDDKQSLYYIAYNYINSHGRDLHGKPLGQYFIHGLGHHIGLDVHDPGGPCIPFAPGMVVTIEPGIYIPEENLGVRIEDDFLITETGAKFLSEKLPRDPDVIEKIMAKDSASSAESAEKIRTVIEKYARSVGEDDVSLAAEIWSREQDVSMTYPFGEAHGFEQIKQNVYQGFLSSITEGKLTVHDVSIHVYGDTAWAEFLWHFEAKLRANGSPVSSNGRETQLYRKGDRGDWRIIHVHYSAVVPMPSK